MANMEQVIEDRCSLFLALAVTDLIVASLKEDPSWQLVLEFIVGSLLNLKQVKIHVFPLELDLWTTFTSFSCDIIQDNFLSIRCDM